MLHLHMRIYDSISSGAGDDDEGGEGYGVFGGPAMDVCATIIMFCLLAASVVIWEACAFAAMAALLLGAVRCLVPWTSGRHARTTEAPAAATPASGLTDTAIDEALPASPYGHRPVDDAAAGGVVTCSVCLEDVRRGEMVRSLPECRHLFHVGCIDVWLRSHATCPLCRSDLSPRPRLTAAPTTPSPSVTLYNADA